jgi:beta-lactamase regulating signal transducer with metallopeptidase domain
LSINPKFQINTAQIIQQPIYWVLDIIAESNTAFEVQPMQQVASPFNYLQLITTFYWAIGFAFLATIVFSLKKIYRIYKHNPKQKVDGITLINTTESGTPFSFFNYIFWNTEIDTTTNTGKQILQHELTHVHEKHSWDKILMQINLVFGWFNPSFWLIKKELEMIHEFIADNKAIANSNVAEFASILLVATFPTQQYKITNPFFFSPIK